METQQLAVSMHDLRAYLNINTMTTLLIFSQRKYICKCWPTSLLDRFVIISKTPTNQPQTSFKCSALSLSDRPHAPLKMPRLLCWLQLLLKCVRWQQYLASCSWSTVEGRGRPAKCARGQSSANSHREKGYTKLVVVTNCMVIYPWRLPASLHTWEYHPRVFPVHFSVFVFFSALLCLMAKFFWIVVQPSCCFFQSAALANVLLVCKLFELAIWCWNTINQTLTSSNLVKHGHVIP